MLNLYRIRVSTPLRSWYVSKYAISPEVAKLMVKRGKCWTVEVCE